MSVRFLHRLSAGRSTARCGIAVGVALVLMVWLANSFGIPIARAGWVSPTELLNSDGTLNLTTGKVGTVDVQGWDVRLDPQRGPVFAPNAPTAGGWSALGNEVNSSVAALAVNGSDVYVGGYFTQICGNAACNSGNTTVNHIASLCTTKPAKSTLTAPADGAVHPKPRVTLKWSNVACETKYKVRVKNAATNQVAFKANLGADIIQIKTTPLPTAATYKWFVKACNSFGCAKSAVRTFQVP